MIRERLQISQRGLGMPASPIRMLAPLAYVAEDRGIKIYRLSATGTGQWHSLKCLESGTILLEAKDGAYEPIQDCDILKR